MTAAEHAAAAAADTGKHPDSAAVVKVLCQAYEFVPDLSTPPPSAYRVETAGGNVNSEAAGAD